MKKLLTLFGLGLLLLMSACVSVVPTGNNFNAQSENGLVLFSLADRALFKSEGGAIALVDNKGEKRWVIFVGGDREAIPTTDGKGTYYYRSAELKPGRYEITNWRMHNSSGGDSVQPPKEKLIFEIGKGEVVYLGSLNVIRFAENAQFRDRFQADKNAFIKFLPLLSGLNIENKAFVTDWWPLPGGTDMSQIQKSGSNSK